MKTFELLKIGSDLLKDKKIMSFNLDSELLLTKVLKKSRQDILKNLNQKIHKNHFQKFSYLINRRSTHEPVAYILKKKEFWNKFFYVTKDTLIPRPEIIDDYIKHVPFGKSIKLSTMRNDLAIEYQADKTCPVTAGIFLRIVSEASFEELNEGKSIDEITPFWRMVHPQSK